MATATVPLSRWESFKVQMRVRGREWRYGLHRLSRSRLAVVGLVLVTLYLLMALLAPVIAPTPANQQDPYKMRLDFANELKPPGTPDHVLGTGKSGVDLFYGVVWGARISVVMGVSITLAGAVIGTVLGGIAGYYGGKVDEAIMRLTDIFLAMPVLILAMAVTRALGTELVHIGIALVLVWWPSYTRLVRGTVLSIRENQYVEAARAVGGSDGRIILRHILPNSLSPILVQATLDIGSVVLLSAALSFIGFGPGGSNFAEWGNLVSQGQEYMQRAWWSVTVPGLAIFGFVLGFNLLGDGLRDLLDPRLRR